jgi:hypothetical protein
VDVTAIRSASSPARTSDATSPSRSSTRHHARASTPGHVLFNLGSEVNDIAAPDVHMECRAGNADVHSHKRSGASRKRPLSLAALTWSTSPRSKRLGQHEPTTGVPVAVLTHMSDT